MVELTWSGWCRLCFGDVEETPPIEYFDQLYEESAQLDSNEEKFVFAAVSRDRVKKMVQIRKQDYGTYDLPALHLSCLTRDRASIVSRIDVLGDIDVQAPKSKDTALHIVVKVRMSPLLLCRSERRYVSLAVGSSDAHVRRHRVYSDC